MSLRGIKRIFSAIFALVMLIGLLPATALARTIIPVEEGNGALDLKLLADGTGKLLWDPVTGATGYRSITTLDYARANSHTKKASTLTGYELLCADVVAGDGNITTADAARINAHVKGTSSLW